MKTPSDNNIEQQFSQWLDNQEQVFDEALLQGDKQWRDRARTAKGIAHQVALESQQKVPNWNRAGTFIDEKKQEVLSDRKITPIQNLRNYCKNKNFKFSRKKQKAQNFPCLELNKNCFLFCQLRK